MKCFAIKASVTAALLFAALAPAPSAARSEPPLPYDTSAAVQYQGSTDGLPQVRFIRGDTDYLLALNPDLYTGAEDLRRESRWVRRNAADLELFWKIYGDSALFSMSAYAGVLWQTAQIDLHLVRYAGAWEITNPPTLPLGGRRIAGIIEAAPTGVERIVALLHLVAHQLIADAPRLEYPQLNHPLARRTPYHRENLCELLALSVAADIIEHDALLEMMNDPEYARRHPGYELLFTDLWGVWTLSAALPLTDYLSQEPFSGSVRFHADSALAAEQISSDIAQTLAQRKLPIEGQMGLALEPAPAGLLVKQADPERLGFAYGIVEGDVIRTINGLRAQSLREFYREFLSTYETAGAELRLRRGGQEYTVTIKLAPEPLELEP
ncbi:MAG TPA: hypothetical protein VLB27_01240 [candidate division Zixibacteria bacterium]|nr:hypothetical protein [candidate division Zixibacteria bacterium]